MLVSFATKSANVVDQSDGILQNWSSTKFQNKSVIAKANLAVEKGASTYYGGSISTTPHFEKMIILLYFLFSYI